MFIKLGKKTKYLRNVFPAENKGQQGGAGGDSELWRDPGLESNPSLEPPLSETKLGDKTKLDKCSLS